MRNRYAKTAKRFAGGLVIAISGITVGATAFAETPVVQQPAAQQPVAKEAAVAQPKAKAHNPKHAKRHYFNLNKVKVPTLAVEPTEEGWKLGRGWLLTSGGGLSYVHPDCADYFFKLSGILRFDETVFMGSYRDTTGFANGTQIRTAQLIMDGGIGQDWSYTFQLGFTGNRVFFQDTWLSYSGFMENNQVYVGRVSGNWFGLENASGTSWMPFLERSLQANAFYPGDGLGAMTDFWWDNGGLTITAMQPDQGGNAVQGNPGVVGERDRWSGTIRGTIAPVHCEGDVWHFGMSGAYRELVSSINGASAALNGVGVVFRTTPSARSRNTPFLLNTSDGNLIARGTPIRANNVRMFNVEAARQYGPFIVEAEYTNTFVHRIGTGIAPDNRGTLRFDGWNLQTRYMLTGEIHKYDVRDGFFGGITPCSCYGAWEIAARYDFLNLSDKDVRGGTEHNVTVGLNWFLSQHLRLSANYIRASIHPANDIPKRNIDIIGLRCQVKFK